MVRQVDAGDRAGIQMRRIEQREERALGRAVEAELCGRLGDEIDQAAW
jgi:hypothetical protein